jgi:hypothetical protein
VEKEGQDALEVGPQAHAAKDAQDEAEESIGLLVDLLARRGKLFISPINILLRR